MELDKIIEMWKEDSVIDDMNLDLATIKCASYHSKYLELFSMSKIKLKKYLNTFNILERDKWMYYMGKMTKEEMDKRGWPYDPYDGLVKPLKSDIEKYIKTDKDVLEAMTIIDYQKTLVETLEEILTTIRWRHSSIKNIIEAKKFMAGC